MRLTIRSSFVRARPVQYAVMANVMPKGRKPQVRVVRKGSNTSLTMSLEISLPRKPWFNKRTVATRATARMECMTSPIRPVRICRASLPSPCRRATRIWIPVALPKMSIPKVRYMSPAFPAPLIADSLTRARKKLSVRRTRNCTKVPIEIGSAIFKRPSVLMSRRFVDFDNKSLIFRGVL